MSRSWSGCTTSRPARSCRCISIRYQRYAYVLQGTLQVTDVENTRSFEYKAGDFIVEMVDGWHYGANNGNGPVRLLVIDQVEKGKANTIVR